jgi:uroporphyrinogen-III synthase
LAAAQGRVLSRTELLAALPRGSDEHAVEMAVARLRSALGGAEFVQTVVKRGYRLRLDPPEVARDRGRSSPFQGGESSTVHHA